MREAEERDPFEEFGGRLLKCWMQLEEIRFLQQPQSFLHSPALGTTREQMLKSHFQALPVVNYMIISALHVSATGGWWSASL